VEEEATKLVLCNYSIWVGLYIGCLIVWEMAENIRVPNPDQPRDIARRLRQDCGAEIPLDTVAEYVMAARTRVGRDPGDTQECVVRDLEQSKYQERDGILHRPEKYET
tara:strand:- start:23 stop:346 length:324 start_codon:yes stop_codon:yes gene_type:complete